MHLYSFPDYVVGVYGFGKCTSAGFDSSPLNNPDNFSVPHMLRPRALELTTPSLNFPEMGRKMVYGRGRPEVSPRNIYP